MTLALEEWRDTLKISKFILVSHSLSSYVALSYSIKYPNHIENLYLISPGGLIHSNINPTMYNINSQDNIHIQSSSISSISSSSSSSLLISYISNYLWNSLYTPMDFLRWLGPLGPYCFSYFFSWYRKTQLPSNSLLHQYTSHEINLLSQILYQNFASPPFGEKSLSYFISNNGQFHQSLLYYLHNLYLSLHYSNKNYGTFTSPKNIFGSLKKIVIIWGIDDKWYKDTQNNIVKNYQNENIESNHNNDNPNIKQTATEEFLQYFQFNGIETDFFEIKNAGHFVQLDNPKELCQIIIDSYF